LIPKTFETTTQLETSGIYTRNKNRFWVKKYFLFCVIFNREFGNKELQQIIFFIVWVVLMLIAVSCKSFYINDLYRLLRFTLSMFFMPMGRTAADVA